MGSLWIRGLLALVGLGSSMTAAFSVDGKTTTPTAAVATVQPRTGAPDYYWLRVFFYASPLAADDLSKATEGRIESMRAKWSAVMQLTVDKGSTVWQVDLALPGHSCTVAESDGDAKKAVQTFGFDGTRLRLAGKGSHLCAM